MKISKKVAAIATAVAVLSAAGIAGATVSSVLTRGGGPQPGVVKCPGGMSLLGHEVNENMSIFAFDPAVHISDVYTVANEFFEVEGVGIGSHAGTHLDAPRHFIEGARGIEDLAAEDFVWPAYKIVTSELDLDGDQVSKADIRAYERDHGRIKPGSMVILQTGAEALFGLDGPGDERVVEDGLANNVDDLFTGTTIGFEPDAIQWMFDKRNIDGVGSDAYGPDASSDVDFNATFTTLFNDGVALVAIANLDSVNVRNDVIMAPTIALSDGSGFSTNPIACHGAGFLDDDNDDDDNDDD